jgi:GH15 family glucan-1,4-alpha-glucosidase/ferredoxin
MPRDIPVGNGRLLVTFDDRYQVRDIYFPHVGQENHAGAGPCRFGVYADLAGRPGANGHNGNGHHNGHGHGGGGSQLFWSSDPGWTIRQRYLRDTLTTSVSLDNRELKLAMYCNDVVDFNRNILVRKIKVKNLAQHHRTARVFHHQGLHMFGTNIGNTAYYDPELRSIVHYHGKRYLMVTFWAGGEQRIDEYATGTSGFAGAEGTWRDAEDGHLQGNPIAQGAVDSTISHHVHLDPDGERTVYMVMIAAESRDELLELHRWMVKHTPQGVIDRTTSYWRLWVGGTNINFGNLPNKVVDLFKRSLLVLRTQIDNGGAIIAANDSDIMQFARDTYSYMWPRDGALVANSLDLAGFPDVARWFYSFCQRVITDEGYYLHKYNPDGSPASSWHPWVLKGQQAMPIQEDETALVVWALWRHYYRYRDIEFIRPLWVDVVQKAADFMVRYVDKRTGLPLPSYDLWEERWGVHAFTVATVYGGLKAAHNFAVAFGDRERAAVYGKAAEDMKAGAAKYLFSEKLNRFVRRLVPKDTPKPPDSPMYEEPAPLMFEAEDPRVASTMKQVEQKLWVKTRVGGVARYENDYYHRVSNNIVDVPGNPWFICTLWLADYYISRATTAEELKLALPIFEWTAAHALESGVLAEQVNPYTNAPLSVSPLTWSHATVVSTAIKYLEKLEQLQLCVECNQPVFRLRRRGGTVEVKDQSQFGRLDAMFEPEESRETASTVGHFFREGSAACAHGHGGGGAKISLSIDTRDCIGCEVCVAHCDKGVLRMIDGKAMVDLRNLNKCDLDGECVEVCPTNVVELLIQPVDPPAPLSPEEERELGQPKRPAAETPPPAAA